VNDATADNLIALIGGQVEEVVRDYGQFFRRQHMIREDKGD
jgi:hypothetical protein